MTAFAVEVDDLVRVRLLSGFAVSCGGQVLSLKPGAQRLVAFLALLERSVERRYAAFRLWPDKGEDRAMANLRSALWRIRLLPVLLVKSDATHLGLEDNVWVDARHGLASDGAGAVRKDIALAGELLPDWYDEWLLVERERLRQSLLHALETASASALAEHNAGEAIDLALRAVALEPLRESAHRYVIEAHLSEGNVAEAVSHYDRFSTVLREELGVRPSPELSGLMPTRMRA